MLKCFDVCESNGVLMERFVNLNLIIGLFFFEVGWVESCFIYFGGSLIWKVDWINFWVNVVFGLEKILFIEFVLISCFLLIIVIWL